MRSYWWAANLYEMTTRKGVDVEAGPSPEKQVDTTMHDTEDTDHPASSSVSPDTGIDINEDVSTDSFRLQMLSAARCQTAGGPMPKMHIPIVGYEVMEERARFTVYKLRIENKNSGECWFVFRRYTDFVRLHARLKGDFPSIKLSLPKKRWFGDNFDPDFLEERIEGLQCFINAILDHTELCGAPAIKDFFCIDEPPSYAEGVEESRAIFESLEETIYHLRHQLKEKESELSRVRSSLVSESMKKEVVFQFVRNCMKNCPSCSLELSKFGLSDTVKFTSLPQKISEVKSADDNNGLGEQGEISRTQKDTLNSTSQEVLTAPSF